MDLRQRIESLVTESGIPLVGVAFHSFPTGEEFEINGDLVFHAASMMKVPVMLEAYHLQETGRLSLEDRIPIKNSFTSLVGGDPYSLKPEDDGDISLYDRIGESETIRQLIELMITKSGNLATNLLVERFGADNITARMNHLGAAQTVVRRGVMDEAAFEAGVNNTTSAKDFVRLLVPMARGEAVSEPASKEMLAILSRQEHNEAIPAGLPSGTVVAHKTGWNTDVYHDGGIVFIDATPIFALTVFTKGSANLTEAHSLIARLAKECWASRVPKYN